jgi:ABC-type branched-subunit amino acid transport system ATPase component
MTDNGVLTVRDLNVSYGESKVLFDVSMQAAAHQVVACVGRNGAGKSTLLKTISGFLKPRSGSVMLQGTSLVGMRSYTIARMGMKYVPQDKKVFSDLTVRENLELASYATCDTHWDKVMAYFPKLKVLLDRKAGFLSGGERQMLMIGRAILGDPQVLLIDEPTEGLAPSIVSHLKDVFQELAKRATLVIVEQNLALVCGIADKIYAIKEGRVVSEISDPDDIKRNVCEMYL